MGYLIFYIIMIFVGGYATKKFDFSYREILELMSLPIAIPMFITVLFSRDIHLTPDTLLGLIALPLLLAFIVAFAYPVLVLPVLLILVIKQNYIDKPIVVFFLSTLVGGLTLSMVSLEVYPILTGMILTLLSILIQYYYLDKKRKERQEAIKCTSTLI
jgi:hypothetical protein